MDYIILDLEWNQAYYQKAQSVQKKLSARLRGEVIQIGAVKLNEKLDICGSYTIIVKPRYFTKVNRHVMLLTGITQQIMDRGVPLPEAIESFRDFCGDDFAFLTWGPDDIPMLKENLNANSLNYDWIDRVYDLQSIYSRQIENDGKQHSLEYAMEKLGIEQTLPAHDALNDAYFTALVAKKLDISAGIASYNPCNGKTLSNVTIGDSDVGETGFCGFTSMESLVDNGFHVTDCPICHTVMERAGRTLHSKGQRYITPYTCRQHGDFFTTVRLTHNINGTYRMKITAERSEEARETAYREGLRTAEIMSKKFARKGRKPQKKLENRKFVPTK